MSRSEITIWYWNGSIRVVSDFSNDLHAGFILYCVLKSVSPQKRKLGPSCSASDLFTEGMMFFWLLDTPISHTCHVLSYGFLSHLWEAVCYPALFPWLILPGRHPVLTGICTQRHCVSESLRNLMERQYCSLVHFPGTEAAYSLQHCSWCFILPKLALIFCYFRLAQSLEKTLLSGNPIMTFLRNFTVTGGKYVVPPSLLD